MKSAKQFGLHAITSGFNAMKDELLGFAVCLEEGKSTYIPVSKLEKFKDVLRTIATSW